MLFWVAKPSFQASRHRLHAAGLPQCKDHDTIRYDSEYLTCSKKLTGSQLSLPQSKRTKVVRREASKAARSIGVEAEGNVEGCLPPQPTRGSGKSRKLRQYGPRRSPGRQKTGFGAFRALKTHVLRRKCSIFDIFCDLPPRQINKRN